MAQVDNYTQFVNTPVGKKIVKQLGLPSPINLDRYKEGQSFLTGPALVGGSEGGFALATISEILVASGAPLFINQGDRNLGVSAGTLSKAGIDHHVWTGGKVKSFKAIVFDATGIESSDELVQIYNFFKPLIKKSTKCGRIIVVGRTPENCDTPKAQTAQRGLIGFIKAAGKELKKGSTANLIYVDKGAEKELASSLQFFTSNKSTYVDAQFVRVQAAKGKVVTADWAKPLDGKVALVTGAARGIGASIAKTLARDGATVVCLDIPQAMEDLQKVADQIGGEVLAADITAADSPERIADYFTKNHKGLDVLVHNAGVTRDKTLAKMSDKQWNMVIDINLSSEERINDLLLEKGVMNKGGKIVCVSSISGIAGNVGQVNYATSKAGVIGMVESMAPVVAKHGLTINAVAPGFIETKMTAAIPMMIREAGRRMNSMAQGGLPVDVAEAIAYFASPASRGLNGNVIRVCGQALIGA